MINLVGIRDIVKVHLKGEGREAVMGNCETVTITQISEINGEVYYTGDFNYTCPVSKAECSGGIQFKEGEYEVVQIAGETVE